MTVLMVDDNELNLKIYARALHELKTVTCVCFVSRKLSTVLSQLRLAISVPTALRRGFHLR